MAVIGAEAPSCSLRESNAGLKGQRGTLIAGSRYFNFVVCRRVHQLDNWYFFRRRWQYRFACSRYPSHSGKDHCACDYNCQFDGGSDANFGFVEAY
jgi:hypothetical protein